MKPDEIGNAIAAFIVVAFIGTCLFLMYSCQRREVQATCFKNVSAEQKMECMKL